MKLCKMCKNELTKSWQDTYCSNKCKYSDGELNAKRIRLEKNDSSKVLQCNICEYKTKDILNLGGHAKKHLILHNIVNNEYMEYYTLVDAPILQMWCCPECDWKSKDLNNISGWITSHVITHMNIDLFIQKYPIYSNMFSKQLAKINKDLSMENIDNRIICEICKEKFYKLSQTHLLKHGITPSEYKIKYNIDTTASNKTSKLQSIKSNNPIIKSNMIKSIIRTNNKKFGYNSYTQTPSGKKLIRERTLTNAYNKYIASPIINNHVQLLFSVNEYDGNRGNEYKFLCKKCNREFIGKIENGKIPRCFDCYPKINTGVSNAELEVKAYIENEIGTSIEKLKINNLEFDIYIPSYNIAIEYDGLYWHSEINGGKDKEYHIKKTNICNERGIRLIHIFEDEWLYKKESVKSKLSYIFKKSHKKIYARKCHINEISDIIKNAFLNEYHLQSADNMTTHNFGLYYENELVSVMSFRKYRYNKNSNIYELSRFANKNYYSVIGAFSKLLAHFIKHSMCETIITYADKRWSINTNNVYLKNGFNYVHDTCPSYWYINNSHNRLHRFNYRKSKLSSKLQKFDNTLTEWENMQLNGYDRIWDCGSLKYELDLTNKNT